MNDTVFENGDISQNGTLETEDITIMQKYLHCQNPVNEEQAFIADLNQDGMLNVIDLALLKKQLLPDKSFENNPVAFLQDYLHRLHSMTEEQSRLLDKNQDGTVNVIDLALLKTECTAKHLTKNPAEMRLDKIKRMRYNKNAWIFVRKKVNE